MVEFLAVDFAFDLLDVLFLADAFSLVAAVGILLGVLVATG